MPKAIPLRPQHELFCQLYVKNEELFGNGTLCYAEAYNYKLETLSHEETRDEGGQLIEDSEYDKAYNVCSVRVPSLRISAMHSMVPLVHSMVPLDPPGLSFP
jgi:hypothetical protein